MFAIIQFEKVWNLFLNAYKWFYYFKKVHLCFHQCVEERLYAGVGANMLKNGYANVYLVTFN